MRDCFQIETSSLGKEKVDVWSCKKPGFTDNQVEAGASHTWNKNVDQQMMMRLDSALIYMEENEDSDPEEILEDEP